MGDRVSTPGLSDLCRAVFRHKKKSLCVFSLVLAVAAATAIVAPKSYHSEGLLLVRLGKENAMLDSTVTLGQEPVITLPYSRDNELNSVAEIIKSRAIAEKVVDLLGADFILHASAAAPPASAFEPSGQAAEIAGQIQKSWTWLKETLYRLQGPLALNDRDRAIIKLMARTSASQARKSDLIQIECKGPSPEWTQKVVATLMEVYEAEHMRLNRPNRSVEFLTEQMQRARRDLLARQTALRDLKTSSGIFSPVDQRKSFAEQLSALEAERLQSQAAAKVASARVETLHKQLRSLPAELVESVTTGIGNMGSDQVQPELYQLEVRREEAQARYTDAHPVKKAIEDQLQASRALAGRMESTRTHVAKGQNRVYQETQSALLQEEALLAGAQAKNEILTGQLAALRSQIKDFNEQEVRMAGLDSDIEVCETTYRKYSSGMEQAKIDQARETAQISNITVAEPATCDPDVVFPRISLCLALGALCGLAAAVAVAWWAESRNHTFHSAEDVERRLGLDVLGSIPRVGRQPAGSMGSKGR